MVKTYTSFCEGPGGGEDGWLSRYGTVKIKVFVFADVR